MQSDILTKKDILYRAGLFTVLELIFSILAVRVLISPVVLSAPPSITFAEAKGGFTLLTIIWHALAVLVVKDVALFFFSSEWLSIYRQTGGLDSKYTDRVSKVTAGLIAQARHFPSNKATTLYRASLLLTVFLAVVGGLGPSALFVNTMLVDAPTHISLANISFPDPRARAFDAFTVTFRNYFLPYERANNIFRMETFENVHVGYDISDNVMIPWPHIEPGFSSGKLVYSSDIMAFNHTCSWHEPVGPPRFVFVDEGIIPGIAGIVLSWTLDDGAEYISATLDQAKNLTSAFSPNEVDPLIGLLFFANNTDPGTGLNVSGLPALTYLSGPQNLTETTVTALLCNPNLETRTAQVTLFNNTLTAHTLPSHTKPINNLNSDLLFQVQFLRDLYDRLLFTLGDSESLTATIINSIVRFLFFCARNDSCEGRLQPSSLPTINNNMNQFVRLCAKGVLDGFNGTKSGINTVAVRGFNTFITDAIRQEEKMVLVASRPILIALIVVVMLIESFLMGVVLIIDPTSLKSFNLDNVAQIVYQVRKT